MAEHSPTPWRVEPENHDYPIRDANGSTVAMFVREADAALIVDAVNRFTAHGENAPLPPARGAELSSASRPTDAELPPAVTAGETASMLLPWTVEGPFPGRKRTKKHDGFAPYANIVNRIGTYVAQGLPPEVAAGIVDAVNERDRLRDLVRELADEFEIELREHYKGCFHDPDDPSVALLNRARAALGEAQ